MPEELAMNVTVVSVEEGKASTPDGILLVREGNRSGMRDRGCDGQIVRVNSSTDGIWILVRGHHPGKSKNEYGEPQMYVDQAILTLSFDELKRLLSEIQQQGFIGQADAVELQQLRSQLADALGRVDQLLNCSRRSDS